MKIIMTLDNWDNIKCEIRDDNILGLLLNLTGREHRDFPSNRQQILFDNAEAPAITKLNKNTNHRIG